MQVAGPDAHPPNEREKNLMTPAVLTAVSHQATNHDVGGGLLGTLERAIARGFGWGLGNTLAHHLPLLLIVGVVAAVFLLRRARR